MKAQVKFALFAIIVLALTGLALPALADDSVPHWMLPPNAVIYSDGGSVSVWTPNDIGGWQPVISLTPEQIAGYADVTQDTLVASSGTLSVWKLNTGEWQVSNGPDADGKVNVLVFSSDFTTYSHWYEWSVYTMATTAADAGL